MHAAGKLRSQHYKKVREREGGRGGGRKGGAKSKRESVRMDATDKLRSQCSERWEEGGGERARANARMRERQR